MFTGIVETMGTVVRVLRRGGGARLEVRSPQIVGDVKIGDSVSVNGACVTVTGRFEDTFACDLVPETLARTNLGTLQPGEEVNLERPLHAASRLDGHIVQGHIDVVGTIRSRRRVGAQELLEVTVETTTLGRKLQGAAINVEVDVISKYVERHLAARQPFREPSLAELVGPPPPRAEPLAAQPRMAVPAPAPRPAPAPSRPVPTPPRPAAKPAASRSPAKPKPKPKPAARGGSAAKRSTPASARSRKPQRKR
jgi:riboflavin synthase